MLCLLLRIESIGVPQSGAAFSGLSWLFGQAVSLEQNSKALLDRWGMFWLMLAGHKMNDLLFYTRRMQKNRYFAKWLKDNKIK